mmetsp:Transcript_9835/g.26203  ORF Transcript_9835/g.26203 Transcript_9835/m.26203 type:complete len:392 (-) Transcript_9835:82-1257(-)
MAARASADLGGLLSLALVLGFAAGPAPGRPHAVRPPAARGSLTLRRQQAAEPPLFVACGEIAALAGYHNYKPARVAWRGVIKTNFKPLYNRVARQGDARLLTPEDRLEKETKAMGPSERRALYAMRQTGVHADSMAASQVGPRKVAPSMSEESAKEFVGQVRRQRGARAEKVGLETAEKAEKKSAVTVKGRMAKLEAALMEEAEKQVKTVVQEVARKVAMQQLEAEIANLKMEDSCLSASFTPGNLVPKSVFKTCMFKSAIAPGLSLRGRIDALRMVEGASGGEGELHIIEHKARQHGLFTKVRDYERIQCLGYIHLVRDRNHRERGQSNPVRCILVETFEGDTSRTEVLEDADYWEGNVVDVVRRRAEELWALARGDPSASDVQSWLERL